MCARAAAKHNYHRRGPVSTPTVMRKVWQIRCRKRGLVLPTRHLLACMGASSNPIMYSFVSLQPVMLSMSAIASFASSIGFAVTQTHTDTGIALAGCFRISISACLCAAMQEVWCSQGSGGLSLQQNPQ